MKNEKETQGKKVAFDYFYSQIRIKCESLAGSRALENISNKRALKLKHT